MIDRTKLSNEERLAIGDEGFRSHIYRDSRGKPTIGFGFLVASLDMTEEEALPILRRKIAETRAKLEELNWFALLDEVRKAAFTNMAYQMGLHGLLSFHRAITFAVDGHFDPAADEAFDSDWARETPARAREITEMIRTGRWPWQGEDDASAA